MISVARGAMRRFLFVLVLVSLAAGCVPRLAAPTATPVPTVSLKPDNLLTPRPTPQATATPAIFLTANAPLSDPIVTTSNPIVTTSNPIVSTPEPTRPVQPTATAKPSIPGRPVVASEPLQGFLVDDRLFSPIIGSTFAYRVYLPPDYPYAPQRTYPVAYMLHGNGGNYTEWSDSFLPEQIDRLIVANEIQPMIVVMPDDGESTYFANWDNGPRWGDYIAEDVVSTVDQRYRTMRRPEARAVGGLSMGGLGALNLAMQRPDVFGVVGGHSPSVRLEPDSSLWFLTGENFWEHNPVWLAKNRTGLESVKFWLDVGTDDIWLPNIEAVHQALVGEGLHVEWHQYPGPHEAEYWIAHVPDYLRFYSAALGS
jgi:enterochelin esterase-like enzyme